MAVVLLKPSPAAPAPPGLLSLVELEVALEIGQVGVDLPQLLDVDGGVACVFEDCGWC